MMKVSYEIFYIICTHTFKFNINCLVTLSKYLIFFLKTNVKYHSKKFFDGRCFHNRLNLKI